MKTVTVNSKEIGKSPTLCMSPLRYLKECHKCDKFKKRKLSEALKMKCQPRIKPEILELLKRKEKLLEEIKEINEKLRG
ncbi:hypothetical protein DRN69_00195 [Candidatus Pacearchaeota archaeon]|nr:MAG: hypothetical protein DRN69_00195 [Candidatus Pacearchaeota archaeon]